MDIVEETLDVKAGALLLAEGDEYLLRASFGLDSAQTERLTLAPGQGIAGRVVLTGQSELVATVKQCGDASAPADLNVPGGDRSVLCVPLRGSRECVVGVLQVMNPRNGRAFDEQDLHLLESIASYASIAVHNAQLISQAWRLSEDLEARVAERTEALEQANQELVIERDRLNSLYRIMSELSSSLDLERMLNRALALINRLLGAEQGYVLTCNAESSEIVYKAAVGTIPVASDGRPFPAPRPGETVRHESDRGLIGWMMSQGESVCIDDLSDEEQWHILPGQHAWHRSVLAAPMSAGREIRGLVLLYHSEPGRFTADHQRMLTAIASQLAVAASSIEMFHLLSEAADRLGRMLRAEQLETAKSQAILEGVADGVMVTDAQGTIVLFNAAAERILQIPRQEVLGCSQQELPGLFNLTGTSWADLIRRWTGAQGDTLTETLYEERFEFQGRVISMRVAPVIRQQVCEGTVSVFRDITVDVKVDRMKSEFVSMVSHELRTPLTSIKGYLDLLYNEMTGPITDTQRRFLQVVRTNTDRLVVLVNGLLEINRLDSGELNLTLEDVDLERIVRQVVARMQPQVQERQHTLCIEIPPSLPPARADRERLAEILSRLVENAVYYTPEGGEISIHAELADGRVHTHVRDTGIGISAEDQPKLFSRFFRADDPLVQTRSGTGMGLFIVKSLVELHGGEMWFQSLPGRGSTFSFSLPTITAHARKPDPAFKTIRYRPQDKHILVVEDEANVASLIAHELRSVGRYRVHVVRYGQDALDYLVGSGQRADLITLDMHLPDISGEELLRRIKADASLREIPIVVVTASADAHEKRLPGVSAHLPKPLEGGQALAVIDDILSEPPHTR